MTSITGFLSPQKPKEPQKPTKRHTNRWTDKQRRYKFSSIAESVNPLDPREKKDEERVSSERKKCLFENCFFSCKHAHCHFSCVMLKMPRPSTFPIGGQSLVRPAYSNLLDCPCCRIEDMFTLIYTI